jgi:Arc/MetJ-type ribon-helix-helix transcriptional regulator
MPIEIHNPDLEERVRQQIQSGQYHDVDELLTKALDALGEQATSPAPQTATGAVVLAALQASPYRDIDLTPPRVRLTNVRVVEL